MKKTLLILFILVSLVASAQTPPISGSSGTDKGAWLTKGVPLSDSGFWNRYSFPDTTAANKGLLKNCPGIEIRVGDTLKYLRNQATTKWILVGGSGVATSKTINGVVLTRSNDTIAAGGDAFRHIHYQFKQNLYQGAPYSLFFASNSLEDTANAKNLTQATVDTLGGVSMMYWTRRFYESQNDTAYHAFYGGMIALNELNTFDSVSTRFNTTGGTYIAFPYHGVNVTHYIYTPKNQVSIHSGPFGQTGSSFNSAFNLGEAWGYNWAVTGTSAGYPFVAGYHSNLDFQRTRPHNQRTITGNGVASFVADWRAYQAAIAPGETNWGHYVSKAIGFAAYGQHDYATVGAGGATKAKILLVSKVDSSIAFYAFPQFRNDNEVYNGYSFYAAGDSDLAHFQGIVNIGGNLPTHVSGWPQYKFNLNGDGNTTGSMWFNPQTGRLVGTSNTPTLGNPGTLFLIARDSTENVFIGSLSNNGPWIKTVGNNISDAVRGGIDAEIHYGQNATTAFRIHFITYTGINENRYWFRRNAMSAEVTDSISFRAPAYKLAGMPTGVKAFVLMQDANGYTYKADTTGLFGGGGGASTLQQVFAVQGNSPQMTADLNEIKITPGGSVGVVKLFSVGANDQSDDVRILAYNNGTGKGLAELYGGDSVNNVSYVVSANGSSGFSTLSAIGAGATSDIRAYSDSISFLNSAGRYRFNIVPYGSIDTTSNKPAALDINGRLTRMNSWAQVVGPLTWQNTLSVSGGSTLAGTNVISTGTGSDAFSLAFQSVGRVNLSQSSTFLSGPSNSSITMQSSGSIFVGKTDQINLGDSTLLKPYLGKVNIDSLRDGYIDTTLFKPLARKVSTGDIVQMNSWAQVSGGGGGGGSGTVTSVSFTGGLISVANPTTTPAFTVAGTSGGIPYFSSSSTWATSAALAANAIVIGGGAGAAPATTTTGTGILTWLGTPSSANLATAITDETGTAGLLVFNNTPTIITPSFTTGFTIGGTAASGTFPRANGTNFVASSLILPNTSTANRVVYSSATNTYGESANFTFDGSTALTVGSAIQSTFNGNTIFNDDIFLSTATATDANYTPLTTTFAILPTITANRTLTVTPGGGNTGRVFVFANTNNNGFNWNFTGTVKDYAGNTISSIPNQTVLTMISDGTQFKVTSSYSSVSSPVSTIGTINSQTKSANGAVISGTSLVLQTVDASFPGLMTSAQKARLDSNYYIVTPVTGVQVAFQVSVDSLRIKSLVAGNSMTITNNGDTTITIGTTFNPTVQTLTDASTITWNVTNGGNAAVTLGATGRTLSITNPVAGNTYTVRVIQDGTGSRTITTWPTNTKWPANGTAPTLTTTASRYDVITFYYDGTNYYGNYNLNYN